MYLSYGTSTFCQSGTNPVPTFAVAGGLFSSSSALLSIDVSTGVINLSASTLGTYTVTYATAGPCPTSTSVSVTITDAFLATFSYTGGTYCQGGTNPSPTFGTGASGGIFTAPTGIVIDSITGVIDLTASTPGTYTVTNTIASSGGCAGVVDSTTITINPLDNASFNYSAVAFCQSLSDQTPTITGLAGGLFSSTPSGLTITSSGVITPSSSTTGVYTVTYTTNGTCVNTSSVTVTINDLPIANAGLDQKINCGLDTVMLDGSASTSGATYLWTAISGNILSGGNTTTPLVNQAGTYVLTVMNGGGCSATDTAIVTPSGTFPVASFTTNPDPATGSAPLSVNFTNTSQNATIYSWTFGDVAGTTVTTTDANFNYTVTGTYMVILTAADSGLCSDTASVYVTVTGGLFIPEGFSPNGDGTNDLFVITGIDRYPNNKLIIFNRWGNKVYEANPYVNKWDGKATEGLRIGGDDLPTGTYFYLLDLGDGSEMMKGSIYLNR